MISNEVSPMIKSDRSIWGARSDTWTRLRSVVAPNSLQRLAPHLLVASLVLSACGKDRDEEAEAAKEAARAAERQAMTDEIVRRIEMEKAAEKAREEARIEARSKARDARPRETPPPAPKRGVLVCLTSKDLACYHTRECSLLKDQEEITLVEARKRKLKPCRICLPPS